MIAVVANVGDRQLKDISVVFVLVKRTHAPQKACAGMTVAAVNAVYRPWKVICAARARVTPNPVLNWGCASTTVLSGNVVYPPHKVSGAEPVKEPPSSVMQTVFASMIVAVVNAVLRLSAGTSAVCAVESRTPVRQRVIVWMTVKDELAALPLLKATSAAYAREQQTFVRLTAFVLMTVPTASAGFLSRVCLADRALRPPSCAQAKVSVLMIASIVPAVSHLLMGFSVGPAPVLSTRAPPTVSVSRSSTSMWIP